MLEESSPDQSSPEQTSPEMSPENPEISPILTENQSPQNMTNLSEESPEMVSAFKMNPVNDLAHGKFPILISEMKTGIFYPRFLT